MTDYVHHSKIVLTTAPQTTTEWQNPNSTLVWLEDFQKHCDQTDVVKSADEAGDSLSVNIGRTKYKAYRKVVVNGVRADVLTSDNKYIELSMYGRYLYVLDKPAITRVVQRVANLVEGRLEVEFPPTTIYNKYQNFRTLISQLLTYKDFQNKSVLVALENTPGKREQSTFQAYVPVEGYYVSTPVFKETAYEGYDMQSTINNEKTEQCTTFLHKHRMNNLGGIKFKVEGSDNYLVRNSITATLPPATRYQLADCERTTFTRKWKYLHEREIEKEGTTVRIQRVYDTLLSSLAKDPERLSFKEQLVMNVFHPDRVARFMGDTWGIEESWLNQI